MSSEAAPALVNERESDVRELLAASPNSNLSSQAAAVRVVEALRDRGVDTFFGIPGGPICPVFEALRITPGVRLIESRHETAAAFAAVGYHRSSGRVPAVVVTAGPGATNAVTGVASASSERTPMLVLAGDVAWASHGGCLAQDSGPAGVHLEQIFAPITRAQERVQNARSAVSQTLAALDAATDPLSPGPALVVLPLDCATPDAPPTEIGTGRRIFTLAPDEDAVREACEALAAATHPLIVLGGGCRGHEEAIQAFVDAWDIPFVTTPRAKGIVSELHPRSLRTGGMAASQWAREYTALGVDCALVLGTDLDDTSVGPTPYIARGGQLFHVDLRPRVFQRNLPTALGIQADIGAFAREAYRVITERGLLHGRIREAVKRIRATSPFDTPEPDRDDAFPIRPHRVLRDLERAMGPDARFVTDIGEHMLFALHYLTARRSDQFTIQLNLGSMGSGIAGAIGVALADPSRPVLCVCGDGGMQMNGMEILVAQQHELPIVYAVFNDARYNMVHHGMRQIFGQAGEWETPPVDFAAWARSFGMAGNIIRHPSQLEPALAARGKGPLMLDIRVDRDSRIRGGGRVEALQHMSMLASASSAEEASP